MLPAAPRRGCLAPSGRGLWRGAGRRVASSPPGGVRSESVPQAAPCETAAHALVCGLGRAVSASAKPRARDCRSVRFTARRRLSSLAGLWQSSRGAFCTCPSSRPWRSVRLTLRAPRQRDVQLIGASHNLRTILPTLRTILLNGNQFAASDIRSSKTASSVLQQALGRATRRTAAQAA